MPDRPILRRHACRVLLLAALGVLLPANRGVLAEQFKLTRVEQFPPLASDWQLLDWRR